jgi:hypothetical protein
MADLAAAPDSEPLAVPLVPTLRVLAASVASATSDPGPAPQTLHEAPKYPPALETFRSVESTPEPSNGPSTTPVRPQPGSVYDKNSTPPPVNTSDHMTRTPVTKQRWRVWAALAALGLLAAGAWAFGSAPRSGEPSVNALKPRPEIVAPGAASATANDKSVSPAQQANPLAQPANATKASLTVHTSPEQAEVYLDGARLAGNPAQAERPRDGSQHVLEIRAAGYRARKIDLRFDRDRDLEVNLTAEARAARAPQPGAARAAAAPGARERPATSSPEDHLESADIYDRFPSAPPSKPTPPPLDTRGAF